jgi:hypothetical protein
MEAAARLSLQCRARFAHRNEIRPIEQSRG